MSRIGKKPIPLPKSVEIKIDSNIIEVKGPKGIIATPTHPSIAYMMNTDTVIVTTIHNSSLNRAQHGLRRTLLANCIEGVTIGFKKTLEVVGVGYKVAVVGGKIELMVGLSHPIRIDVPKGIDITIEGNKIIISGIDKQLVGQVAATIRNIRPPEPYKGKGIKYVDEIIRHKVGKSSGKK